MKQVSQEESEHRTPERSLGNTDRNAEKEERGVRGRQPGQDTPQGLMAGEKGGERSYAFPSLALPELQAHRVCCPPDSSLSHPPKPLLSEMGRSQRGEGLIFCVGFSRGKEAGLVPQKVETASCFDVKKKKKVHSQNTGQSDQGSARGEGEIPVERANK